MSEQINEGVGWRFIPEDRKAAFLFEVVDYSTDQDGVKVPAGYHVEFDDLPEDVTPEEVGGHAPTVQENVQASFPNHNVIPVTWDHFVERYTEPFKKPDETTEVPTV